MYACGRRSRDGGNEGEQRTRSLRTRGHKRPRRAHHGDPGNRTQHHGRGTLALFSTRPRPLAPQFLGVLVAATSHFDPYVFVSSRKRCRLLKQCSVREMNTRIRGLRDRSHSLAARICTCYILAESPLGSLELRMFEQNITISG